METSPIRAPSLYDLVTHALRVSIISGQRRPGEHLVETQLAARFEVSRGPVRDALRQLEAEGLAESRRGRYYVIGIGDHDISELYQVRLALEALAVELCVERCDDRALGRLSSPIERMVEAARIPSPPQFAAADMDFHSSLYELSGNSRLGLFWSQIKPTFALLLETSTEQDADLGPSAQAHLTLLESLRARDVERTVNELRVHLRDSEGRIRSVRQRQLGSHDGDAVGT